MKQNPILLLNKRYYILKKIFIILLIIFVIIHNFWMIVQRMKLDPLEINTIFSDVNLNPKKTKGKYPGFKNLILNYENNRPKYFKYRQNSREDIVIFAYINCAIYF